MTPPRVLALSAIYHADGGVWGELRYALGKLRGETQCALCDITHGALGMKRDFAACQARLPVSLTLIHRDEQSVSLEAHTRGQTPCVVAHTPRGLFTLLGPKELHDAMGDVASFERILLAAVQRHGLSLGG